MKCCRIILNALPWLSGWSSVSMICSPLELLLAGRLLGRCRGRRWPIRVPDVADVEPGPVGTMVDRQVAAAVEGRARGVLHRVRAADPAHVAVDFGTRDGA